jgi:hypothetical protein
VREWVVGGTLAILSLALSIHNLQRIRKSREPSVDHESKHIPHWCP